MTKDSSLASGTCKPYRKSIRAPEYDYSSLGSYFVTICVADHRPVLATIECSRYELTLQGRIVEAAWFDLPNRFDWLRPDAFVIMPNHVHAIIEISVNENTAVATSDESRDSGVVGAPGVMNHAPTKRRVLANGQSPVALGEIVRTFKAVATRSIRRAGFEDFSWQRNYYEHIIRSDRSLGRIRDYIDGNPAAWAEDRYFDGAVVPV